jgi:polyhydroxybutyrate depolymerase
VSLVRSVGDSSNRSALRRTCPSLLLLALLVVGEASARPGAAEGAGRLESFWMVVGGRARTYHVLVPDSNAYDPSKPAPLVLALHGGGGNGVAFLRSGNGQFEAEADARHWIVVFPDGVEKGWVDGREATTTPRKGVDDVDFLGKLIDRLAKDFAVDTRRVYVTGISNGGFMSIRLALELSEKIAAAAAVTASLPKAHEHQVPARPVPILFMNGTDDPLVPYEGGMVSLFGRERGEVLSTYDSARRFRALNGCAGEAPIETLPDKAPRDGTRVYRHRGMGCKAAVVVYRIEHGGHTWPGGRQYLPQALIGRVSRDISAAHEIFELFAAQRLP